ncbi:MAG TPA: PaaI family thioesterase [Burkholderiaceae bacterium]|nr:PaaI family thioesterase [Burkholderiaceae bacterium]
MHFVAANPAFEARVRASFARQAAMRFIGARLADVAPGRCTIELPVHPDLSQQHGFVHGGIVGMIADSAGGYSAFSLMPDDASVLTVEFKINLLAPARGDLLIAAGAVVKPGRTLSIARADVFARENGRETLIATLQQTLMVMQGVADEPT